MSDTFGYAVFLFPPALEALGEAIKPYVQSGAGGVFVPCREVDTGGAFVEMTLNGRSTDGHDIELELMVPSNMVRMIVSVRSDAEFGFYDRNRPVPLQPEPAPAPTPAAPQSQPEPSAAPAASPAVAVPPAGG